MLPAAMDAELYRASWDGAPGWLVLPEPPGDTPACQLVERSLNQAKLLSQGDLPAAIGLASGSWRLDVRALRAVAERMASLGVNLAGLCATDPLTRAAAAALGLPTSAPLAGTGTGAASGPPEPPSLALTVHQGTLRAGDHLEVAGSLLVLGDVNPGARVSAGGDVRVWGRLRGAAHAGSLGDPTAKIVALQLRPLQLRIADAVARGPEDLPPAGLAEQAVLVGDMIRLTPADPLWPLNG
ncbi:MAG: septum site-determining protein MinC [Cyanobium sp.]|jgi:septum site-determining protein MinC